jgi:hypothetical protein
MAYRANGITGLTDWAPSKKDRTIRQGPFVSRQPQGYSELKSSYCPVAYAKIIPKNAFAWQFYASHAIGLPPTASFRVAQRACPRKRDTRCWPDLV